MKLIIDITDNEYRQIKEYYEKNDPVGATYSYIYHGIPLDKIRDEIDDLQNTYIADGDYNEGIRFGAMQAYLIIDKYTKGEGE